MAHPIERAFPGLSTTKYTVTSPPTPVYNCIAWAADDDGVWWWPDKNGEYYWPEDVPREEKLRYFAQAYAKLGYEKCKDGTLEPGIEKVALYADAAGHPKHAARQLVDGSWTSKLGKNIDISHELVGVEGQGYGKAVMFLKRPRATMAPAANESPSFGP